MANKNKIKVVVFDFDDTLYSGLDKTPWKEFCRNTIIDLLGFLSKEQLDEIKVDVDQRSMSDRQVIEYLSNYGVDKKAFEEYKSTHEVIGENFDECKIVSNKVLKKFADNFKLYIVSNSVQESVLKNCEKIGIDTTFFEKIIGNNFIKGKESKRYIYQEIIESENIKPNEFFVIGNNFEKDILPALIIGGNGQKIDEADFKLEDFFDKNLNVKQRKIFFTSDTHFSQERTLNMTRRPFKNIKEMNKLIIKNWNKIVEDEDIIFHLGDFGDYKVLNKLKGKKVLILGNYEQTELKNDFNNNFNKYKKHLINLGFSAVIEKNYLIALPEFKDEIFMTHKPIDCKQNKFNLFGHIHNFCKIKEFGLNVGIDNYAFKPASMEDVLFFKNAIENIYINNIFCTKNDLNN